MCSPYNRRRVERLSTVRNREAMPTAAEAPRLSVDAEARGEKPPARYRQIREELLRRIDAGRLRRGEAMPNEVQLAREFAVAVGTVRKAVDELVARNVVERRHGKGLFVAAHDA